MEAQNNSKNNVTANSTSFRTCSMTQKIGVGKMTIECLFINEK